MAPWAVKRAPSISEGIHSLGLIGNGRIHGVRALLTTSEATCCSGRPQLDGRGFRYGTEPPDQSADPQSPRWSRNNTGLLVWISGLANGFYGARDDQSSETIAVQTVLPRIDNSSQQARHAAADASGLRATSSTAHIRARPRLLLRPGPGALPATLRTRIYVARRAEMFFILHVRFSLPRPWPAAWVVRDIGAYWEDVVPPSIDVIQDEATVNSRAAVCRCSRQLPAMTPAPHRR